MKDKPTIFITGGGTGGHIYPAVAVADYMKTFCDVYYVGNPKNLEYDIVTKKDYKFLPIKIKGMPRKACLSLVLWMIELFFAVLRAIYYEIKYKPDAVFGTGGYVSAPSLIAAKLLSIPFIMHDCDANPGLVTRKLAPYAACVSLAFDKAKEQINNKNIHINGNPIRSEFKTLTKEQARKSFGIRNKMTICIMGGSQGAKSINMASVNILKTLSKNYNVQIIFQTGKKKYDEVEKFLMEVYPDYINDKNIIMKPYFDDMVTVLKASDIAVSRAGSLSISELCASGVATIFVPYPHAAADHQRKNAKLMENYGAGCYLEDDDVSGKRLLELLVNYINNPELLSNVQFNASSLAKYNGTYEISEQIKSVVFK